MSTMSNTPSPSKREQSTTQSAANDEIIPLIIATNPGLVLNYKAISALDPNKRTHSSFEHRFRKWKARAKELNSGSGDLMGGEAVKVAGGKTPKKRVPKAKNSAAETSPVEVTHDLPAMADEGQLAVEPGNTYLDPYYQSADFGGQGPMGSPTSLRDASVPQGDAVADGGEVPIKKANVTKKRATKAAEVGGEESPAKKRKVVKKGTAKVVKNDSPKKEGEESGSIDEEKPKAKGKKPRAATVKKSGPKGKGQKPEVQTPIDGQEIGESEEMKFE